MKLQIYALKKLSNTVTLVFTNSKGITKRTYTNSPPSSLDDMGIDDIINNFENVRTEAESTFIKNEYKRLIKMELPTEHM